MEMYSLAVFAKHDLYGMAKLPSLVLFLDDCEVWFNFFCSEVVAAGATSSARARIRATAAELASDAEVRKVYLGEHFKLH